MFLPLTHKKKRIVNVSHRTVMKMSFYSESMSCLFKNVCTADVAIRVCYFQLWQVTHLDALHKTEVALFLCTKVLAGCFWVLWKKCDNFQLCSCRVVFRVRIDEAFLSVCVYVCHLSVCVCVYCMCVLPAKMFELKQLCVRDSFDTGPLVCCLRETRLFSLCLITHDCVFYLKLHRSHLSITWGHHQWVAKCSI